MYSSPILFDENGKTTVLTRAPLERGFNEEWLQTRLFHSPQAIPFGEIDPGYIKVIPLCMEMQTGAGPIDIVYITPQGKLVVVETKLFRNPEARRKVIGQILDYAKELISWSYADLQREVSRRTGIKGNSPYKLVKEYYPETDEAVFVDGVSRSLEEGDFMLVVAGDGIHHGAEGIVNFLQNTAHMKFTLAMLEVAVFQVPLSEQFFIQPRLIVKTETVERVYSGYESGSQRNDRVEVSSSSESRPDYRPFWEQFIEQINLDDPEQPIPNPSRNGNIFFPLPPSGGVAWITVYFSKSDNEVGCFLRLTNSEQGNEYFQQLLEVKDEVNRALSFEVIWDDQERRVKRKMKISGEWPPFDDEFVTTFFNETVNEMVNTFRPLLKSISQS